MKNIEENVTEKKYQHYVPKFYLRLFSNDKKSIGTYIFKSKKYISNAPIKGIGGSDYFYGKDGKIEDWFSNLEGKWSIILRDIIENNQLYVSREDYIYLLMFIYLSDARSKNSAKIMDKFINELAITTTNMDKKQKVKHSYKEKIASFDIPNIYPILVMQDVIPILLDLKIVLIINSTSHQFITSDCLVTRYNQFLLEKGYKRGYAYGTCGIECFLPISPKHCLCLYDDMIYQTKEKNDVIIIKDYKEIDKMNSLFLYNSDENIFFNNNVEKSRIDTLVKNRKQLEIDDDTIFKSEDGELIIKMGGRYIDRSFNFNFIFTRTKAKKIKINLNMSAPIRPYVEKFKNQKDVTPREVINRIENKKFYLEKKE